MIPKDVHVQVEELLSKELNEHVTVSKSQLVGGGCINEARKITTSVGLFFLKWNSSMKFPGMFQAEARGLTILSSPRGIDIPRVIAHEEGSTNQILILSLVEAAPARENYWILLGSGLAELHSRTNASFGLDHNNYIGSLEQNNKQSESWPDFFINTRLRPQLALALERERIDVQTVESFNKLFKKVDSIVDTRKPSLLHGDLWSGNIMVNERGEPVLIDPAVYYGNREVDIAMTKLFGGFDRDFYESYNSEYPLEPGAEERFDLYNLYPLLVHVNLFGGGYLQQVKSCLRRFD
jgi:protein-ribulosamine 3-kinase